MLRSAPSTCIVPSCLAAWLAFGLAASAETLTLVHVNDLDRFEEQDGRGGVARLASVLKELGANQPNVIVTHGGDMISPSLLSGLDHGAHMIALNNALGIEFSTLGNHEFDFGPEVLLERLAEAEYPWLTANVRMNGAPFPGTSATAIVPLGAYTVGLFGLTTPETAVIASPGERVSFVDPVEAASAAVAQLQEAGADVIVALTHLKLSEDEAVAEVEGIDVILGGHDHEPMTILLGDTLIHKSGAQAEYVGVIEIDLSTVEGKDGPEVQRLPRWRMIPTAAYAPDPELQPLVDQITAKLDQELGQTIGSTAVELDTQRLSVRTRETTFGNLVADVLRAVTGADVAITNGGGIRGDKVYEAGTELTRGDILGELPFGNKTVLLQVSGATVEAALENGFSQVEERAGRFPQVSNLTVTYDPAAPAGERVTEVLVGRAPLDPDATYMLATNDYMAGGGDGYAVFQDAPRVIDIADGRLMATQVIDHIAAAGTVAPQIEGRIKESGS